MAVTKTTRRVGGRRDSVDRSDRPFFHRSQLTNSSRKHTNVNNSPTTIILLTRSSGETQNPLSDGVRQAQSGVRCVRRWAVPSGARPSWTGACRLSSAAPAERTEDRRRRWRTTATMMMCCDAVSTWRVLCARVWQVNEQSRSLLLVHLRWELTPPRARRTQAHARGRRQRWAPGRSRSGWRTSGADGLRD